MPNISTTDAQGLYTKKLIDVYKERPVSTTFIQSFFPTEESDTLELSIEVQRGTERVAVDVTRGTEGNRNQFSKSSEKIFVPPYYSEYFDVTQLHLYDRLYGATEINDRIFAQFINNTADRIEDLRMLIERAYEKQCVEVLIDGTVTLKEATTIDFKRKSGSKVDLGAGQYFANAIDPFKKFEAGCKWLREVGKVQTNEFNAILGATAFGDLLTNAKFLERQDLIAMRLDSIAPPQKNSVGGVYHGTITAGAYRVNLWTYPEVYEDSTGTVQDYIDPKKVILLPTKTRFKLGFGAVPQLIDPNNPVPTRGAYVISEYKDQWKKAHLMRVESAGVAIPVAVDQIYTFKAVA